MAATAPSLVSAFQREGWQRSCPFEVLCFLLQEYCPPQQTSSFTLEARSESVICPSLDHLLAKLMIFQ